MMERLVRAAARPLRSALQALFSPPTTGCMTCGGVIRGGSNSSSLGICSACFASIPWIRSVRCPICGRYEECGDCRRRGTAYFTMNRSAVAYDERMKEWLARWKYRGDEKLGRLFGRMMIQAYRLFPADLSFDCITFVPLSAERLAERGFNQAERLAREVGSAVGLPVLPLLLRTRHTGKQSFKTRRERLADLNGAFTADPEGLARIQSLYGGRRLKVLVVDDVYTTGSTMNQCGHVLHEAFNDLDVYGLCWAR